MGVTALSIPEVREYVIAKFNELKNFIKSLFKKKEN